MDFGRWFSNRPPRPTAKPAFSPAQSLFLPDEEAIPFRPTADFPSTKLGRHAALLPRPTLSVVIGSFNRRALLEVAIAGVRRQIASQDAEIIVVDGGSTDGTVEWLTMQSDIIAIVQHNRVGGSGVSRRRKSWGEFMNLGFRGAEGDLILMISDDCLLLDGAVAESVKRWREAEAAGIRVGACAYYFRDWPADERYYVQRTLGGNLMVNHGLYSRRALEQVGWADGQNYVFYKADTDLSLKLWAAGYAVIDSPGSICEHYVGLGDALRASNTALMEDDRAALRARWPALVTREAVSKMGKVYLADLPSQLSDPVWLSRLDAERSRVE